MAAPMPVPPRSHRTEEEANEARVDLMKADFEIGRCHAEKEKKPLDISHEDPTIHINIGTVSVNYK